MAGSPDQVKFVKRPLPQGQQTGAGEMHTIRAQFHRERGFRIQKQAGAPVTANFEGPFYQLPILRQGVLFCP